VRIDPGGGTAGHRLRPGLRGLALTLVGVGLVVCALPIGWMAYGEWQERQLTQRWETDIHAVSPHDRDSPAPVASPTASSAPASALPDGIAFAMRIPRVGYYAAVREGVSLSVLATGPGHYQWTAWPGHAGLVGIAAHNTYWLALAAVQPGDEIQLETRHGIFRYAVSGSRVVSPSDGSVLRPAADRQLTLTTCWLLWAGSLAQQRLAIFARQL
jgi:LPXTG-site transpeptidase (sortase) family protein